jgi:hypothetical protein
LSGNIDDLRQINPMKDDPCIGRSGTKGQLNAATRMQADPSRFDEIFKRTLAKHISELIP